MNGLTKDAKQFVSGMVVYLKKGKKDTKAMPKVEKLLTKMSKRSAYDRTARVTTSVAMSDSEKKSLGVVLEKRIGIPVQIEYTVDPSLGGGMRIEIADTIIDTSFDTALQEMAYRLV